MRTPTFTAGMLYAAAASLLGPAVHAALAIVLPATAALSATITLLGAGHALVVLTQSRVPSGRLVLTLAWLLLSVVTWQFGAAPWQVLCVQLALAWLLRAWAWQPRLAGVLLEMAVCAGAAVAAAGSLALGHSLTLAIWACCLVLALPAGLSSCAIGDPTPAGVAVDGRFNRARQQAQAALRRLNATH